MMADEKLEAAERGFADGVAVERARWASVLPRVLGELAGSASLCWNPRPAGEFDSAAATLFVERAFNELRAGFTAPAGYHWTPGLSLERDGDAPSVPE